MGGRGTEEIMACLDMNFLVQNRLKQEREFCLTSNSRINKGITCILIYTTSDRLTNSEMFLLIFVIFVEMVATDHDS